MYDGNRITYFAETDSRNKRVKFGIKAKDRTRHVYVIGKTGMGKSTLLENMAIQDLRNDEGMAFIDPHGKTAEFLLNYVPAHRINDVLYFAPFDTDNPISFNVMEDVGPDKRHLVVSGLMSAFKKLFGEESFSDRMQYILQNTILALLEYPGATMLGINRMLTDKAYRDKVVNNVSDASVKAYWTQEFASYTERFAAEATPAIQNKIGQFTSNPLIRNIIGQPKSSFDIRKMMDEGKIIIINLSKGKVGEANANLLGSMLITKVYLAAMSRADVSESVMGNLPNFYLYVDEFQSFANESFANILSEARKYKLNLTIAHQYIEQMSEEVRAAVFGNVGTMITFRVGSFDADVLEKEFAPVFIAEDLVNLGFAQVYLKLMIDGISSTPFSAVTLPPITEEEASPVEKIIEASRTQFSQKRDFVEGEINRWHAELEHDVVSKGKSGKSGDSKKGFQDKQSSSRGRKESPSQKTEGAVPEKIVVSGTPEAVVAIKTEPVQTVQTKVIEDEEDFFPAKKVEAVLPETKKETKENTVSNRNFDTVKPANEQNQPKANTERTLNRVKNPSKENVNQLKEALKDILKNVQNTDVKKEEPKPAASVVYAEAKTETIEKPAVKQNIELVPQKNGNVAPNGINKEANKQGQQTQNSRKEEGRNDGKIKEDKTNSGNTQGAVNVNNQNIAQKEIAQRINVQRELDSKEDGIKEIPEAILRKVLDVKNER